MPVLLAHYSAGPGAVVEEVAVDGLPELLRTHAAEVAVHWHQHLGTDLACAAHFEDVIHDGYSEQGSFKRHAENFLH